MAELFDFGIDFGLSYFEPIPEKKSVTQQEYQKGKIDYYDQTLGALGGDFKIPTRTDDDDDRDRRDRRAACRSLKSGLGVVRVGG